MASSGTDTDASSSQSTPARSNNPLHVLSTIDSSKKYTLVFLVSVGTTLLVTGASGGRLLKKAKKVTAEPVASAASVQPVKRARINLKPTAPVPAPTPTPIPIPRVSPLDLNVPSTPPPVPIFADPHSLAPPRRSLLRSFKQDTAAGPKATAYFLPNATLLAESNAFAENLDTADKLHKDGTLDQPDAPEDGFNPALYAFKAFAIATTITVSAFGLGIVGLMKYLGVNDLQGLSLALSHSLPGHIDSRRPTVPDWAAPPIAHDIDDKPSQDEPLAKRQELEEDMSYWRQVKATLDEEALALKLERRKAWDAHLKAREQQQSGREGRLV